MTPDPSDELLRALAAENAELRELLTAVAQELERMAGAGEMDTRGLLARAQRIRARLQRRRLQRVRQRADDGRERRRRGRGLNAPSALGR